MSNTGSLFLRCVRWFVWNLFGLIVIVCDRFNIPNKFKPRWSINLFNETAEQDARVQVKIH